MSKREAVLLLLYLDKLYSCDKSNLFNMYEDVRSQKENLLCYKLAMICRSVFDKKLSLNQITFTAYDPAVFLSADEDEISDLIYEDISEMEMYFPEDIGLGSKLLEAGLSDEECDGQPEKSSLGLEWYKRLGNEKPVRGEYRSSFWKVARPDLEKLLREKGESENIPELIDFLLGNDPQSPVNLTDMFSAAFEDSDNGWGSFYVSTGLGKYPWIARAYGGAISDEDRAVFKQARQRLEMLGRFIGDSFYLMAVYSEDEQGVYVSGGPFATLLVNALEMYAESLLKAADNPEEEVNRC